MEENGKNMDAPKRVSVLGREVSARALVGACAGVALVAAIACGAAWRAGAPAPAGSGSASESAPAAVQAPYELRLHVDAQGWDAATSSPVIAHVTGEGTDFYHAMPANADESVEVGAGSYEVAYISPVNADGSIYTVPGAASADAAETGGEGGALTAELARVEAADVTAGQLEEIARLVAAAVEAGDDTLTGEAGAAVVERVAANAKANANADTEKIEEHEQAARKAVESGESGAKTALAKKGTAAPSGDGPSASKPGKGETGSKPGDGGSPSKPGKGDGAASSGKDDGKSDTGSSQKPGHKHNWVEQTKTVEHPAEYKTVHHDAVTHEEDRWTGRYYWEADDGTIFWDEQECADYCWDKGNMLYSTNKEWKMVTVVDKEAWDEQVLVKDAWTETVVTGYKCSGCGATK